MSMQYKRDVGPLLLGLPIFAIPLLYLAGNSGVMTPVVFWVGFPLLYVLWHIGLFWVRAED